MLSDGFVIPLPRSQRRYLYSKRPSPLRTTSCPSPPTTATSLVPSPDSFKSTLTDVSYKFPHPPILSPFSFRSCASDPTSAVSSSYSSPCSRFGITLSTSDDGFALPSPRFNPCRVAIKLLVIAKHNGFLHQLSRLMKTSAPSSRPSCNHVRIQWNGLSHFLHDVHRESPSTKPMRANSHPPLSPHHTKPLTPRINVHPPSLNPLLQITPSFFHFPAFPSVSKGQSRRSFIPNHPPPPIPTLVRFSSASFSIISS